MAHPPRRGVNIQLSGGFLPLVRLSPANCAQMISPLRNAEASAPATEKS
jgi:hypothetical protein